MPAKHRQSPAPQDSTAPAPTRPTLEDIISLCKRRGFVYPTSSIYGGLANSYDYGPLGTQLLRNIKQLWWKKFVEERPDMLGLDTQIIQHPQTWVASGHVGSFADPLVEDTITHQRFRADHLIESWLNTPAGVNSGLSEVIVVEDLNLEEMATLISKHHITSPDGNPVTPPKQFNLLFESEIGVVSGQKSKVYLRGETAQGLFTNFKNVIDSTRIKLPFGLANIGRSFRNEVTTGQFVFRTLEFEQAEIEYFFDPTSQKWQELLKNWKNDIWSFVTTYLGITASNLRWRQHTDKERSHYSSDTYDLDYNFSFGWKELWGVAYRSDYDLKQHMAHSGQDLSWTNSQSGQKIVPHVIEPAVGIARLFLMVLTEAFTVDPDTNRFFLKLRPELAPYKIAVFPLLKNKPELVTKAEQIFRQLSQKFYCVFDDRGNIGKRYLAQDEIGTPFCVTVDFDTLQDESVTLRDRDTTKQVRVKIEELEDRINSVSSIFGLEKS